MAARSLRDLSPRQLDLYCNWLLRNRDPDWDRVAADLELATELERRLELPVDWFVVYEEAGGSVG